MTRTELEIKAPEDFHKLEKVYDYIFLNKCLELDNDRNAKLMLRLAIYFAEEVMVLTRWPKEKILDAALTAVYPVKNFHWIEHKEFTHVVIVREYL